MAGNTGGSSSTPLCLGGLTQNTLVNLRGGPLSTNFSDEPNNALAEAGRLSYFTTPFEASLAQLVEQCFRKAWVAGSNPATGSIPKVLEHNGLKRQ